MIRIAVDAMGGDHAPSAVVDGAVAAARHLDVQIALVGPTARRRARRWPRIADWRALGARDRRGAGRHRHDRVAGARRCGASRARRSASPPSSSRAESAAALVSAGHTGATVMAAHAAFGMIPGVDRPALATTIPTRGAAGGAARRRAPTSSAGRSTCCSSRSWAASTRASRSASSARASGCCRSAKKRPRATS